MEERLNALMNILDKPEALCLWESILAELANSPSGFMHDFRLYGVLTEVSPKFKSSFNIPLLRYWRLTNEPRRAYRLACQLHREVGNEEWLKVAWICWLTMDPIDRHLVGDKFIFNEQIFMAGELEPITGREERAIRNFYDHSERAKAISYYF